MNLKFLNNTFDVRAYGIILILHTSAIFLKYTPLTRQRRITNSLTERLKVSPFIAGTYWLTIFNAAVAMDVH